jgi:hypothetical protein
LESVPLKINTIMLSGRSILAAVDQNPEIGELINQVQCGIGIEPSNAE